MSNQNATLNDNLEIILHPEGAVSDLCQAMALCNDARLIGNLDGGEVKFRYEGEPTEAALLVLAEKLGNPCDSETPPNILVEHNRKIWNGLWTRHKTLEFDRERKCMSVICRSTRDDRMRLFVKGAPDTMLPRCKFISKHLIFVSTFKYIDLLPIFDGLLCRIKGR